MKSVKENWQPGADTNKFLQRVKAKTLEFLSTIESTPLDRLYAHKIWADESLEDAFGNGADSLYFYYFVKCIAEEKQRLATIAIQRVNGVDLELRGTPEPECYSVKVVNRTGKYIDTFVRLSISNANRIGDKLVRDPTAWAGTPVAAVMTRPDGVVWQYSASQYFENLNPAGPGSAKSLAIQFAIDGSEQRSDLLKQNEDGRSACFGIVAWLPSSALRWEENIVGRSLARAEQISANRKAEDIAGLERNASQRAAMDAKLKAFLASPRGSAWCKWYKKPEDQYACMSKACVSKSFGDEPACAMPD